MILSAIANGTSTIHQPLHSEDLTSTINALRSMGIDIVEERAGRYKVLGKGLYGLQEPTDVIDVGNSGTTIRLLMGVLAAQPFHTVLVGDSSIARRPMARVSDPLRLMGAKIDGRKGGNFVPIAIRGEALHGITYRLPVASAQVKSALLLAGLYAEGITTLIEPVQTRDHTERMLQSFGVAISQEGDQISISQHHHLQATEIRVPGDFSSSAFFIAAALLVPGSDIILRKVGFNPTRTGLITALRHMGAEIEVLGQEMWGEELVADLRIKHQPLQGTVIAGELIPRLIDELPIIAVLATQAEGVTEIRNAEELRVKESDRIAAIATELRKMKAEVEELPDGLRIMGKTPLVGAMVSSYQDHRIAISLLIAGLIATGKTEVDGAEAINISYPRFLDDLKALIK
jgi:3-phosphoshikimate 1-carboxyvinyltransferase